LSDLFIKLAIRNVPAGTDRPINANKRERGTGCLIAGDLIAIPVRIPNARNTAF
jgi:hypothetical protein